MGGGIMIHRVRITLSEYGRDEEVAERVLDAFVAAHPEVGPVVSQDTQANTLTIVIAVDAPNAYDAWERACEICPPTWDAIGLPLTEIVAIDVKQVRQEIIDGFLADAAEYEPVA
jgi:hypothetical protein